MSSSSTHFVDESGEPFLWLADTAWELFHRLDREEVCRYLDNRLAKGFTVIQAVAIAEMDGLTDPNPYGELPLIEGDPMRYNDAYFEHVDFVVAEANKRGLYIAMLPTWGDKVAAVYHYDRPIFDRESAFAYGRYLGERYADSDIVWVLGGDRDLRSEAVQEVWEAMAEGIRSGDDSGALMTFHPSGGKSSSEWFDAAEWIDFHGCQSGHAVRYDDVYRYCFESAALTVRRPFVNLEPAYEGIGVRFWLYRQFEPRGLLKEDYIAEDGRLIDSSLFEEGCFEAYDIRVAAYWTLLSGGAGYTYGNNAIWQFFEPYASYSVASRDYWYDAMDSEGAHSISHLASLFSRYKIGRFEPDQSLICDSNPKGEFYIAAARGNDNSFAILYFAKSREVEVDLAQLEIEGRYRWFNPREGSFGEQVEFQPADRCIFMPPAVGDWVLVIE